MQSTILAATLVATASYALDIPGLQKNSGGVYASADVANHNVDALHNFSAKSLGKQLPAGIGRIMDP